MSIHSFDTEIAAQVGLNAAAIYQNVFFWTAKNMANQRHIHDDYVWTYNSVRALADLFPYLSSSQIKTAVAKLVDAGLVVEGNFNKSAYDRTKWIGVPCSVHLPEIANGVAKNRQPIPDSKPDIKPDSKQERAPSRKVRLPDDWVPSDRNIEDAMKLGFSQQDIKNEAYKFLNHAKSNGRTQIDWDAAWRTWAARSIEYRGRSMAFSANTNRRGQGDSVAAVVARREASRRAGG